MTPNPIARALSSIQQKQVRTLVMGGQACVLYGAAEFSRDLDLALSLSAAEWERFRDVLGDLKATTIAVPPFHKRFLQAGHAAHFRCAAPGVTGLRIDVMSVMRGLPEFEILWERRSTIETTEGLKIELLSLPDLVQAKKTQRDKDWPMIRRLVEAHYFQNRAKATEAQLRFWMLECRTPEILMDLARRHASVCASLVPQRGLLAVATDRDRLEGFLLAEELAERRRDREYWLPLRRQLQQLRRQRPR